MKLGAVIQRIAFPVAALVPSVASAHTGLGMATDFTHGFAHPFTGMDHLLAMVAVGILAWQIGGRALWLVPLTFVGCMIAGGVLGISGANLPHVELGIAFSIVILGAAITLGVAAPLLVTMAVTGAFAIFHGHAHGAEMPGNASALGYALGFISATSLLHLGGIGAGMLIGRLAQPHEPALIRAAGGLMTVAGLGVLGGMI